MMPFKPSALLVCEMSTQHFEFRACGGTLTTAQRNLVALWQEHHRQYSDVVVDPYDGSNPAEWDYDRLDSEYGISVRRYFAGAGYRDGEQLLPLSDREKFNRATEEKESA